jgi:tetratricopeptide (TPR) repeat protein
MISSTARDLPQHREQVRLACEQAGFAPHEMMEHLPALDAGAIEASLQMVDDADVYIGIFAHRYGSIPDGHDISITEMEYNRAVELDKPRLFFLAHEEHPFKAKDFEIGAEAEKLKTLKDRIGKERVAAFFKSPDDLRGHVGAALSALGKKLSADSTTEEARLAEQTARAVVVEMKRQGLVSKAIEAGLGEPVVLELARRLKPDEDLSLKQAVKEVSAAVDVAITASQRGGHGSNLDDLVSVVRNRIAEKTKSGDIDAAAKEADRGFAEWEQTEKERRQRSTLSGIALLEAGLEQDILRRDASSAGRRVEHIVGLQHSEHIDRFAALRAHQDEWYVRGRDRGVNFDLEVAIEIARLTRPLSANPGERGTALNELGIALATLGERESGTARLEEAVEAFRAALQEWTRERVPLDWATTQNNLGNTLSRLGERESGPARLEEAVQAYRNALQEFTRERVPLEWATTQNNLGNALWALGERESGTARLEEAVQAHRNALQEFTRGRVPFDWAMAQNNLGNALSKLGERESVTVRLEEAVAAYHDALLELTPERVPLQWATTQNNLGNALTVLGEREAGTARLEEAVAAYRKALQEWTHERVPFDWAGTQNNLGNILKKIGEREKSANRLAEAIDTFRLALAVWTPENAPAWHDTAQRNLASAEAALSRLQTAT